jgi:hypothetical protein
MLRSLSNASWTLRHRLQMLILQMHLHAGPRRAMLRAYSLTNSSFNNRAQLWAYVDDFRCLAFVLALCVPLAFLLKKISVEHGGAG